MEKLNILWTSSDKDTFMNMIAMYSKNSLSRGWWDEINLVIWGGSTRLVGENPGIQKELTKMLEKGVTIEACKACADKLKVSDTLRELGIEVKYMTALTGYIKGDDHFISV